MTTTSEQPLQILFNETVRLFHRLRAAAEDLHRQGYLTAARRGVMVSLDRLGPQTVPQLARARPVSRQHVQSIVNLLLATGLVELIGNPAHRLSRLVRLTRAGKEALERMLQREAELVDALEVGVPEADLRKAAHVLRDVRKALESEEWRRLVSRGDGVTASQEDGA